MYLTCKGLQDAFSGEQKQVHNSAVQHHLIEIYICFPYLKKGREEFSPGPPKHL